MEEIKINYSMFPLKDPTKKGIIAVLMYSGLGNPKTALDNAVLKITEDVRYVEFIDAHLDNPYMRIVVTNINELRQETLKINEHKLKTLKENDSKENNIKEY